MSKSGSILLGFSLAAIAFGCGGKKEAQPAPPAPPKIKIERLCVLPVEILSAEPILDASDEKAISLYAHRMIAHEVSKILPPGTELIKVKDGQQANECDASLLLNIVFLDLVEKEEVSATAAQNTAGVLLLATIGFGYFSMPASRMTILLKLTDTQEGQVLWQKSEHLVNPTVSLGETYTIQARELILILLPKIKHIFPELEKGPDEK